MVASAVIVPESSAPTSELMPNGHTLKRRQSSGSSQGFKRPRLDVDEMSSPADVAPVDGSPPPTASPIEPPNDTQVPTARRKTGQDEERRRGKRLFGAILGTLSQPHNQGPGRKRADIERKQQARLRVQAEEEEEVKRRRLEQLTERRREEQKIVDEQSMHMRHANNLAMARFLRTQTEPPLYYKPYEVLPEHEQQIQRQVEAVEADVNRELEEFERQRPGAGKDRAHANTQLDSQQEPVDSTQPNTELSDKAVEVDTAMSEANAGEVSMKEAELGENSRIDELPPSETRDEAVRKEGMEDNEELVVEAGEDSVIY